jgi:multidrug efflux pump subunit AcrA (membrane-fusion protein)
MAPAPAASAGSPAVGQAAASRAVVVASPVVGVASRAVVAVPKSGWGHSGHWRAVIIGSLVTLIIVGSGVAAWAEVSGGSTGYRMATVTRANIGTTLAVVGTVEPVSDAAASFQVGGQVATVAVSPGQQVSAGETLGTLDTTALSESVSSDESTLNADEAKLAEDEANESSSTASSSSNSGGSSTGSSNPSGRTGSATPEQSTTTTTPSQSGTPGTGGSGGGEKNPVITQDQATLTQDQSTLSKDQQQEAADLSQVQNDCTAAKTGTPTGQATCEAALQTVSADEQQVSKDQQQVSKDETALGQALAGASGGGSGSPTSGQRGQAPTQAGQTASDVADFTGNSGSGANSTGTGSGSGGTGGGSANTDTPQQIASDQAAIDTAQANLTEAQQSLDEATLTSPITGTVVSVGINVGDTVSANSSTEIITIIGTKSYEVQATLDSSQIPLVKTGQPSTVEVDGVDGALEGTVSQVGPVQSTSSGYSYPVIVSLPNTNSQIYSGSTANLNISTGEVSRVVAVPTSAVQSLGSTSYVLELVKGQLTRKVIKVGMIGNTYTQVLSGLTLGQSVVLVDYSEAVPSSNTNTSGGLGSFLGGGGSGFPGGGRGFFFNRGGLGGGGGAVNIQIG